MEPLLKQRQHIEDQKQKILATAQKRIFEQKNELSEITSKVENTAEQQADKIKTTFVVADMLVYSRFINKLKRDSVVGTEMLKVLKQDEEAKRKELLKASQERKKYEKLKEIQQAKFYEEIIEEEKKESDEIALNIFRYNKMKSK